MDYNTSRSALIFKEYGRNIQELVNRAVKIEDIERRQRVADYIVNLMSHMNPQFRNIDQFRQKLWDHLFKISLYKLEVKSPYPSLEKEDIDPRTKRLPYPQSRLKYKHYGKNVEILINKAIEMEDLEKQKEFAKVIGNYMKMVYKNWNQEHVDDDQIIEDLKILSNNKLILTEDSNLDKLSRSNRNKTKRTNHKPGGSKSYGSRNSKSSGGSKGRYGKSNNNSGGSRDSRDNRDSRDGGKSNYRKKKRY